LKTWRFRLLLFLYRKQLIVVQRARRVLFHSGEGNRTMAASKVKRVALYLRVSTGSQTTDNQRRELLAAAERHGWIVAGVFEDDGISGAKGRDQRPGLDSMLKAVARKEVDIVAAWSVDRLGRSLIDLVGFLGELHALKIDLYLHQQGIDTTTPGGKAMFGMMGVFAEFERAMIRERVNAGLARARADGTPLGRPRIDAATETAIRKALQKGDMGMHKIAISFKVGTGTVQRIAAALAA
jgi:DNA invertase Pin-like site-specific DNA recombinase